MKRDCFETINELLACYILAIKLLYGLNDSKSEEFRTFLDSIKRAVQLHSRPEPVFWRVSDMNEISDVRWQIKFSEEAIYDSDSDADCDYAHDDPVQK